MKSRLTESKELLTRMSGEETIGQIHPISNLLSVLKSWMKAVLSLLTFSTCRAVYQEPRPARTTPNFLTFDAAKEPWRAHLFFHIRVIFTLLSVAYRRVL